VQAAARVAGALTVLVGGAFLAAWLAGVMAERGVHAITMKTNAALCLSLLGSALVLLAARRPAALRRWAGRLCAGVALLIGAMTLSENIVGWDLHIDQLLAQEPPGAEEVLAPNRMGTPASLSYALAGISLLILSRRDRRGLWLAQWLALAVCLIALLGTLGFLYHVEQLYDIARVTAIAWPTAASLLLLGFGLLCARPEGGPMAHVTADDVGGRTLRWLLLPAVLLPVILGELRVWGERFGLFGSAMGTALRTLASILIFGSLVYYAGRRLSRSAAAERATQEALRTSERRLRATFDKAGVGIVEVAGDDHFVAANDRACEILGRTREQLLHMNVHELTWPGDRALSDRLNRELHDGDHDRVEYEKRYIRGDGSPVWAHVTVSAVRDDAGRWVRSITTVQDITERKRAEEALRQARDAAERNRAEQNAIVRSMTEGLVVFDPHGNLLDMNPAALAMHGFDSVQEIRHHLAELQDIFELRDLQGNVLPVELWPISRSLRGETFTGHEVQVRRSDGSRQWIASYGGTPVQDAAGRMILAIVTLRDVTSLKQVERQLRESQSRLQEANTTLEQRVAEQTAEVRRRAAQLQALASQLTRAEQQERKRLAQVLHDHLQQLLVGAKFNLSILQAQLPEKAPREMLQQVSGLLDESIAASRSLTAELSPLVLYKGTFAAAMHWLAEWMREKHGLTVRVEADPAVDPQTEEVRVLLFQVVRELLFNVVKHAGTDRAAVRVQRGHGDEVRVVVADEGRGFDPHARDHTNGGATGLGLFGIGERLEPLGGRLDIDSAPGKGARVTIVAPACLARPCPDVQAPAEAHAPQPAAASSGVGGMRVLLADDHTVVRNGLARLLATQLDIHVVGQASNGQEAVDLALSLRPDVVVMDVSMPVLDGIRATRRIRDKLPGTCIIALSMHNDDATAGEMAAAGAAEYLVKTSPPDRLIAAIRGCARQPIR
jgi:PAS domain S-box-containing protein